MGLRLALVAGETSGDLIGGALIKGLRNQWPDLTAHGIGGPRMADQGFNAWWPADKLAVRGYVEVLRHYREIVGIRNQLRDRLIASPPDAFIGIDAPDFNLDLEGALRDRGVKTVHFVCPSIWAWRAERVHKLKRCCDHVLCLFPFEPALLHKHGIGATYVGHPLASVIPMEPDKAAARATLGLTADDDVVAILPGSRGSEVKYLAERFFAAAALVRKKRPRARFVVPAVPHLKDKITAAARAAGLGDALQVLDGQSHAALAACDVTLLASGTATLEAALFKRPMVVAYAMNWLTWAIHQRQHLQPWVALPNILAEKFVVPELLQHDATPERLAAEVLDWFAAPDKMAAVQEQFRALHVDLQRDTAKLATDAIQEVVQR